MSPALRRRWSEARLALMLLTRLPAGRLAEPVPTLSAARWAYPLVGLLTGTLAWAVFNGALVLGAGPLAAAILALGASVLVTGGLHHDGLADFADGIGGGRDRAHCLEIMRDSRIGSYGVLVLIFAVGLGASALARFHDGAPVVVFLLTGLVSRGAMLLVLDLLPSARSDGLGRQASGPADRTAWVPGLGAVAAVVMLFGPGHWAVALAALAVMAVVAGLVGWLAHRRIGGQTGDVLGAVQLASETAGLLVLSTLFFP